MLEAFHSGENSMNQLTRQNVYVMRLWHECSNHENHHEAWRVTITDTSNQEKFHFADLDKLLNFFKERLGDKNSSD